VARMPFLMLFVVGHWKKYSLADGEKIPAPTNLKPANNTSLPHEGKEPD
jgi:hypothetical protein